ncbi:MAG: hypothetical protein EXR53_02625 [Dehalococcoidia bacterium]|nr:hypothetical protein [Dehalococcoidia bacterium]
MRQTPINFQSHGLALEGVIVTPEGLAPPFPAAVLCHPHPALGGNMDNPVIMALARSLDGAGIATIRFNFRGIGGSLGTFSQSGEESADVRAALDLFRRWQGINSKRMALVGYSFGAQVILRGLGDLKKANVLVLLSPPLSSFGRSPIGTDHRPKLFLVGERDRLVRPQALQEQVAVFPQPGVIEVMPRADHSWRGHEEQVAQRVARFLAQTL